MKNFNADNQTGKNHEGPHPNLPLKFLTATSIIGDKVFTGKEEHLGDIKDIMIDLSNGKIEYVIIEMGGFLGIGEKFFAIPFDLLTVNAKKQRFTLHQSKETLKHAPGFDKHHWPETNSHEFDDASSYWGGFIGASAGVEPY